MTKKMKLYLTGMIVSIIAMFLWILVAVLLTGGREVEEFTGTDKVIMTGFIVVEILSIVASLVFAALVGTENGKRIREKMKQSEQAQREPIPKRGGIMLVLTYVAVLGLMIGGIVLGSVLPAQIKELCPWVMWGSCAVAALLLLISNLLGKWYVGRLEKQQVQQVQQFLHAHRLNADQIVPKKLALLKMLRRVTAVYAVVLGLMGVGVAVCAGICYTGSTFVVLGLTASLLIMAALDRIRFKPPKALFDDNKCYVQTDAYPQLHALAEKAAAKMGCKGKIRIALLPDFNAGIARIHKTYSVQLGVMLLNLLSEEELYCILLHEFAHMTPDQQDGLYERYYNEWLDTGKTPHYFFWLTNRFFVFPDVVYSLQHSLYQYASSIQVESSADRAMLLSQSPEMVASALLKLKYYELFDWEKGTEDEPCVYEPETPDPHPLAKELQKFRKALEVREEDWRKLLDVEIQSRSATHPTLKLRLEALDIREPKLVFAENSQAYQADCDQALAFVESLICEGLEAHYEDDRKAYYLEPKEQVEAWEAAGKPVVAEEYGDILWALRQLGRNTEAMELCQRAIETLPAAAGCNAHFTRGCHRLHSYDSQGIQDIYFAIENNMNYLQEGMSMIGEFCCLTGNQEELDIYRQKAAVLAQQDKDEYSQTGVLTKKDDLSEENLPEGMLESLLEYIRNVDGGQIWKVYLVRKTISQDFFTSAVVVRFEADAQEDACDEIIHKIFMYLDTCSDWQFSLFDYREVSNVPFDKIPNSCVYQKEAN